MNGKHVVLGVCGGIAAYKAVELCRLLTRADARVSVVMTESATRFVGPPTFAALTDQPVRTSLWHSPEASPHTELGQSADIIVVAPATARLIGEYANGISSDLLTSTLLATRAPVVLAPAMHTEMWEQPAVQNNLQLLRERGVFVVDPERGELAGGDVGVGRLAEPTSILEAIEQQLAPKDFDGITVLVTAGGTREPIDPIRYLGNRSSGKQGHAFADEAAMRGAKVILITASSLPGPATALVERVDTAQQMLQKVHEHLSAADVVVMSAAVADFRPSAVAPNKLKKDAGIPQIELERTDDVLLSIAEKRRSEQIVVGFAAESENLRDAAMQKLQGKKLDAIVANDISRLDTGIGVDMNRVLILDKSGREYETKIVSKRTVAHTVLNLVLGWRNQQ